MDTRERLKQCFENLGFSSPFPNTLHINPSTNFIWQQIINNIKTKSEVEVIKRNILLKRFKKTSGEDDAHSPVQEIEVYNQLKAVKAEISEVKARILEKQKKHSSLQNHNKTNYLLINNAKQKNEEIEIKLYAIELKSRQFEIEMKGIQEMLDKREITSVPIETSLSHDAIYEHLQCLVSQLEKNGKNMRSDCNTLDSTILSQNSMSDVKTNSKVRFSTLKKNNRISTEIQRCVSCVKLPSARALFTDTLKENSRNATSYNDLYLLDTSEDLLPDSCFNFEADDEFLLSTRSNLQQKYFNSNFNSVSEEGNLNKSDTNIDRQSNLYLDRQKKLKQDCFTQDNNITQYRDKIFYNSNRELIWTSFCSLLKDIELKLEENIEKTSFRNKNTCSDDLHSLNFFFIKNNLLCLKSKKQIKNLNNAIKKKKSEIQMKIKNLQEGDFNTLEFEMDKIKLEGAIGFLHKEVCKNTSTDHQPTVKKLKTEINRLKNKLLQEVEEIKRYSEMFEDQMEKIKNCQEETFLCVKKLNKFLFNPSWADALRDNINFNEIEIFHEYPMKFTKQFCFSDRDAFYRNSIDDFSLDTLTPNDILHEITSLLHPYNPPEKMFANILQKNHKLQILTSLQYPDVAIQENEYSCQRFQEEEVYINTYCENWNAYIHSNKVHNILKSSSYMRSNMELWLDMPFRRFISSEREVENKKYSEYEEAFNYFKITK